VLAAAPEVAGLLAAAPAVQALATSRAALHLAGEREYPVPPLTLPQQPPPPLEWLTQYEAVRLFVERARAVRPGFAVTNENAPAVAEICHRLDGLPLAIELAAARVRLFAPEALLARLGSRLRLLIGGPRDLPARQQTLRGAIEWSHGLLAPAEQALLARLAVFSGGWDLEAAEDVCAGLSVDVLAGLEALAEQSLLRVSDGPRGEPRFAMLETIREFAMERLEASGAADAAGSAHAAYFLALAELAEPELRGARSPEWVARLELEHSNLRAAMDRLLALRDYERLARACYALWRFWFMHGHWGESLRWQEAILAERATLTPVLRGRVLLAAGMGHITQSNFPQAQERLEESIALLEQEGDTACLSDAYWGYGHARWGFSDGAGVITALEKAAALSKAAADQYRQAVQVSVLGFAVFTSGPRPRAARGERRDVSGARRQRPTGLAALRSRADGEIRGQLRPRRGAAGGGAGPLQGGGRPLQHFDGSGLPKPDGA
jgi:predicted ATPase